MITSEMAMSAARQHMAGPFVWGTADCLTAFGDTFAALWGFDPLAQWRGTYTGPVEALRVARSVGGYRGASAETFSGQGLVKVERPGPGDAVFVPHHGPFQMALGVWIGEGVAALKGQSGMALYRGGLMGAMTCRR